MADNGTQNIHMSGGRGKSTARWIIMAVIALMVIILGVSATVTVDAGHTGVVTTFGKVSEVVLQEGLHFKIPFVQQVVQIDNRVLKTDVESTSASKDLQTVSSTISVNYRINTMDSANIYKNVGTTFDEVIVKPAIQECVKAVTAEFTAEELITQRQVISEMMREKLAAKINPYGLNIEIFNIISFDFSEEFNKAIEAKQTAQQSALKAEQDLQRIKVEAEQQVEQARAEAEAYRLKNEQITEAMIIMEYISKWDGHLPVVTSDNGSMLLDMSKIMEDGLTRPSATYPSADTYRANTTPSSSEGNNEADDSSTQPQE